MPSDVVWSRRIADELWSGVVTPLSYSLLADVMAEHMVRRRLQHAGLGHLADRPVFRLERGWVYVNASLVAAVMCELPAAVISDGLLSLLPAELRAGVRDGSRATFSPRVLATIAHLTRSESAWMPWSRAHEFRREADRVARELDRPAAEGGGEGTVLAERMAALQRRLGEYLEVVSWGIIYAYVFFYLTEQLLARWGGADRIAPFLAGGEGVRTFEIHRELRACAEAVRRDPARLGELLAGDAAGVADRCLAGELGDLGACVRGLLERHGHRLTARDLAHPTWRERPAALVESLRRLASADEAERPARSRDDAAYVAETMARIGAGVAGPARREIFRLSLGWCREYYALRENMRYHADLFLAALRRLALDAGRFLVERGALDAAEGVFHLTADELRAALCTSDPGATDLARVVAEREADYRAFRAEVPPDVLVGDRPVGPGSFGAADARALRGVGVSPGRAVGPARVVHTLEDLEGMRPGEVIVAAATDPSWTSLLSLGRGLVLEMGGMLSHGAIVARELGIPAVADVARATALVKTGDRVAIDGASGEVEIGVA